MVGPDLLATLCRMGHGDQIILGDAHFPGETCGKRLIRADGVTITALLDGILPLMALDDYVEAPVIMMSAILGDSADPDVESSYREIIDRHWPATPPIHRVERHEFYECARSAFAVVMTGDTAKYGNILLTKGVTPIGS